MTHYANPQTVGLSGEHVEFDYTAEGAGSNSGGPFVATLYHADGTTDVWKTFCVESGKGGDETLYLDTVYKVASTNPHVAEATGNYVTDAAKWLYYQSLHSPSLLAGYTGDLSSESCLQEAIWHGVWLHGTTTPLKTSFHGLAVTWFDAAVAATAGEQWADADLVQVLNPASLKYRGKGDQVQSVLYEIRGDSPLSNPEPSTLILLGAAAAVGLLACAWPRRQ
jgi:hypothetical protein